jgi:Sulfotransferase family
MPREPAPVSGPIFIVSPMGTGSTLLRLILDSHPNIAIPHETGFMRVYTAMRFIPFKLSGRHWARRLGWSDEELDEEARRFFERIFMRYAEQHGKQRWGEKTPQHTWHVGKMKRVFPDSVIVAIVRHPGGAVASNMRRFGHSVRWGVLHCRRYYKEIARLGSITHKRMVIVRYEDLVLQPEAVLRELLDWLGEPWDDAVLAHHAIQSERDHERIEGLSRADEAIRADRVAKWTEELGADDRTLVSRRLKRIAEFYGYSFDEPTTLQPLSSGGSLLFGGPEVGDRFAAFPDLELETREEVPLPERFLHPRQVLIIPYPYERPRFIPGMTDVTAPAEVNPIRRILGEGLNKLPPPLQARIRRWGRRAGLRKRRFRQPDAPEGASIELDA